MERESKQFNPDNLKRPEETEKELSPEKEKKNIELNILSYEPHRGIDLVEFSPDALKEIENRSLVYEVPDYLNDNPVKVIDLGLEFDGYFLIEDQKGSNIYNLGSQDMARLWGGGWVSDGAKEWDVKDPKKCPSMYSFDVGSENIFKSVDRVRTDKMKTGFRTFEHNSHVSEPNNIFEKVLAMPIEMQEKFKWLAPALETLALLYKDKQIDFEVLNEKRLHPQDNRFEMDKYHLGETKSEVDSVWEEEGQMKQSVREHFLIPSLDNFTKAKEILESKAFDDLFISTIDGRGLDHFNQGDYRSYFLIAQKKHLCFVLGELKGKDEPVKEKEIEKAIDISKEMELDKKFILKLERIKKLLDSGYEHYIPVEYYHPEYYQPEEETPNELFSSKGKLICPSQEAGEEPDEYEAVELDGRIFLKKGEK